MLHKKYPQNTLCLLPGLWVEITEVGSGTQGGSGDGPSLGWDRSHNPALRGQGVTRVGTVGDGTRDGMCQDVTRDGMCQVVPGDGMCHDMAESSNCPGAGLGLGGGVSDTRVTEVSPGHPHGHRGAVWALPFPWELLAAAGHLCKVTSEQVSPALAAWRCHQMGNERGVSGINMHK